MFEDARNWHPKCFGISLDIKVNDEEEYNGFDIC